MDGESIGSSLLWILILFFSFIFPGSGTYILLYIGIEISYLRKAIRERKIHVGWEEIRFSVMLCLIKF